MKQELFGHMEKQCFLLVVVVTEINKLGTCCRHMSFPGSSQTCLDSVAMVDMVLDKADMKVPATSAEPDS